MSLSLVEVELEIVVVRGEGLRGDRERAREGEGERDGEEGGDGVRGWGSRNGIDGECTDEVEEDGEVAK
jgi:hypothetical protein